MTTLPRVCNACTMAALALAISAGAPSPAKAQDQTDFAEMVAAMKRLEARVAVLESENKQVKKEAEAARAEARTVRQRNGVTPTPAAATATATPPPIYAMAVKAPQLAPMPSWTGPYWGAAFGLGWMRGSESGSGTSTLTEVNTTSSFTNTSTETSASVQSLSGRDPGAIVNLFLGYNFVATSSIILGAQVEGGVSNIRVKLAGPAGNSANLVSTSSNSVVPILSTATDNFIGADTLDNRWMASVLGRGGVLVDPRDLLYVIGGYTYGRFETQRAPIPFGLSGSTVGQGWERQYAGIPFGLEGATVGAGWERELAAGWALRGEYRYMKFQSKDITQTFSSTNANAQLTSTGAVTLTSTNNFVSGSTTRFAVDMQSLWLGVAHYFGP